MRVKPVIHEWDADHFKWVQYPRHAPNLIKQSKPQIYFGSRLAFLVIGLAATIIGSLVLLFLTFIVIPAFFT
jgi:hypothetical protein